MKSRLFFLTVFLPLIKFNNLDMKKLSFIILLVLSLISCKPGKAPDKSGTQAVKQFSLTESWRTDTVLLVPESVLYDRTRNILYVSNLNYEPRKKDGNGSVAQMSVDGKILNLKWIEGLSSPKGMALVGDTLFAADVDEVVVMDVNRGQIVRKVTIDGIKMINDITSDANGDLYISDTDANRIYKYSKGVLSVWMSEGLNGPNGLLAEKDRLLVASQGSQDFVSVDLMTRAKTSLAQGVGRGDGIAFTGIPGYYVVTDWSGEIFMINPDNTKVSLLNTKDQQSNTADIEYIPELKLLLVPTFFKKSVVAFKLEEK